MAVARCGTYHCKHYCNYCVEAFHSTQYPSGLSICFDICCAHRSRPGSAFLTAKRSWSGPCWKCRAQCWPLALLCALDSRAILLAAHIMRTQHLVAGAPCTSLMLVHAAVVTCVTRGAFVSFSFVVLSKMFHRNVPSKCVIRSVATESTCMCCRGLACVKTSNVDASQQSLALRASTPRQVINKDSKMDAYIPCDPQSTVTQS